MAYIPNAVADESAFTEGQSPVVPAGGVFNDSLPAVASGKTAQFRITERRAAHVNLRREDGTEIGVAAAPVQVSLANTGANATAVKVDGSGVTQPENLIQLAGNPIDTNSGAKSAGTQRVVLATDQPQLTNPLKTQDAADGTPGSAAPATALLAAGSDGTNLRALATDASGRQKVLLFDGSGNAITSTSSALDENFKLIAGTAVDVNSGSKSAGTQRVVIATDQPALTTPMPENLTQLAGTAVDVNSGNKSAGTLRVVLATDQPALTNPLLVTDSADMSGTAAGSAPSFTAIVGGKYNSSAPTPSNGQTLPLQTNANGRLLIEQLLPLKKASISLAASMPTSGSPQTIDTGAPGYAVFAIQIALDPAAAFAAAGFFGVTIADSVAGAIWSSGTWRIPNASFTSTQVLPAVVESAPTGFFWPNANANSVLQVYVSSSSASFTAGNVLVNVYYSLLSALITI